MPIACFSYHKCFPFQFLSPDMCMYFKILALVQNGHFTSKKIGNDLLKRVPLEA